MKPEFKGYVFSCAANRALTLAIAGLVFGLLAPILRAAAPYPGGIDYVSYTNLDSWSFLDDINWTSDRGHFPMAFTNLSSSWLGNGASLVVDTNALLSCNIM